MSRMNIPFLDLITPHKQLEDACQSHGAEYVSRKENRWCRAGSMGKAAAFSFYRGKNLGACGEAGTVTMNDAAIAQKIRMLRDHGQAKKYYHNLEGYNGRLDDMQTAMLRIKLRHLEKWNEARRQAAACYRELFSKVERVVVPHESEWSRAVYHLYVIRTAARDALQTRLANDKIGTRLHCAVPVHLQNAYMAYDFKKGDFPNTDRTSAELLSLPMFPQLTADQQSSIVRAMTVPQAQKGVT
jgi:dTDP-4-amino-4,6-dideoxygalactose transaminase